MDRFRTKQASEAYYIEFDFSDLCGTATVSSATVAAVVHSTGVDATSTITTVGSQSISGTSVYVWVKAGTDGTDYRITCTATASDGSIYEMEGLMLVANIPATAETAGTGPGCVVRPTIEPISLAEIKDQLRIDTSDEDTLLETLIKTARAKIEGITRRALLTQTWDYCLQAWPSVNYIKLPNGCLQSITHVKWKDTDGTETTLTEGTDYLVETNGEGVGRIVIPYGESWPTDILYPSNPITIRFVCGWTTAERVPYEVKAALKLIATDLYVNREGKVLSAHPYQVNKAAMEMLSDYRLWDEFE